MSSKEFTGKVIIVTGASSGIGASVAVYFSKLGASLVLTSRNSQNLEKTQQKCCNTKTLLVTADLTKLEDIDRIVDETIKTFGKIDVLVNNAGIFEMGSLEEANLEQLDRIFSTNIRPVFQLTKLSLPHLRKTKGNIITLLIPGIDLNPAILENVSSTAGLRSMPGILCYCMAKAALDQFTKCVAMEEAPNSVRVDSVNLGVIETDIFVHAA